jgi:thiamine biosynthesis protein ThiS
LKIKYNGQTKEIEPQSKLDFFLNSISQLPNYYVVAVNYECISSSQYKDVTLTEGDEVEVLSPMEGG